MTVWVKIFHFLHGGRKFSPTETRERFEQQGENSFNESKKGAVGCFMKELIGKNKVQTISSRRGQNSNNLIWEWCRSERGAETRVWAG